MQEYLELTKQPAHLGQESFLNMQTFLLRVGALQDSIKFPETTGILLFNALTFENYYRTSKLSYYSFSFVIRRSLVRIWEGGRRTLQEIPGSISGLLPVMHCVYFDTDVSVSVCTTQGYYQSCTVFIVTQMYLSVCVQPITLRRD
jgi:hypothetical protein